MDQRNKHIALLTARVLLGLIFFMQGWGKVFTWGVENVYRSVFSSYTAYLPEFLLKIAAYYTSYVELIAGFLVILGLFRNYALYALASVLVMVTFGHGLSEPIWDLQHVMYRAILLLLLLLLPGSWDQFRLDSFLRSGRH